MLANVVGHHRQIDADQDAHSDENDRLFERVGSSEAGIDPDEDLHPIGKRQATKQDHLPKNGQIAHEHEGRERK